MTDDASIIARIQSRRNEPQDDDHWQDCPAYHDPDEVCDCDDLCRQAEQDAQEMRGDR